MYVASVIGWLLWEPGWASTSAGLLTLDVDDSFGRCLFGTVHSLCRVVFTMFVHF